MSFKRWPVLAFAGVLLLSLIFFAAACGDGDEEGVVAPTATISAETPTEAPATQPAETPTTAPAGTAASGATIDVSLKEFEVNAAPAEASGGPVTFDVSNDGSIIHNFRVIRSDLDPDDLPVDGAQVDEEQVEVVASIEEFSAGETRDAAADLQPGSYVLICNVAGHYDAGMRVGFTVQ